MNLLSLLVGLTALVILFSLWIGVHLLARKRLGPRKLGCQGPSYDVEGNAICCHTGEACDRPEQQKASSKPSA